MMTAMTVGWWKNAWGVRVKCLRWREETLLRDKCADLNLGWPPNLAEVLANKEATTILRHTLREIKELRRL